MKIRGHDSYVRSIRRGEYRCVPSPPERKWVMLIISLATGQVNARIPYLYLSDCERDAVHARAGNFPGTVRVTCEKVTRS
jgi:hypothetical protein